MDHRTREVLEFDKVLEYVGGRATSSLGKDFVHELEPAETLEEVQERFAPLRELITLFEADDPPPLSGIFDATEIFDHARVEGSALEEEDWPRIAVFLQVCADIAEYAERIVEGAPNLGALLGGVFPEADLARKLDRTFDQNGQMRDDASPELARARRALRHSEQALMRTVSKVLGNLKDRGVLQEEFSTVRNGRHVFPIRSNMRGRVTGIHHGSSASGETSYIEPSEIVEASNEIEMFREEERREVYRILRELTSMLRPYVPVAIENLSILREADGLLALARISTEKGWHIPLVTDGGALRLFKAHHPLLNLRGGHSVPISVLLEKDDRCVVISGPNAGGKTTAMKTIGMLALLVKCGCPIPAFPDSSIPVYSDILADIGDQQDLEEGLSTFTGHIRRIRDLWKKAANDCLVLMDELGTGTDPQEGGALAVSLLESFIGRAGLTITTSHLNPVKVWAEDTAGARNASFSLDPSTREPTFTVRLDIPGASEALEIAEKEGLPTSILGRARELAGPRILEMGELLRRIEERERRLATAMQDAEARARSLEEQETLVRARAERLREERREARESLAAEKGKAAAEVRERIEKLIAELPSIEELQRRKEALIRAREEVLREQNVVAHERRRLAEEQVQKGEVSIGQRVFVKTLRRWGDLQEVDETGKRARLLVGNMEVTAKTEDLLDHDPQEVREQQEAIADEIEQEARGRAGKKRKKSKRIRNALRNAEAYSGPSQPVRVTYGGRLSMPERPASMTLDLHGYRVDEAIAEMDRFIDRSILADFPHIRICHGTGSGRLYKAVHEYLRTHRSVKSFRFATSDEGGGGVTIVDL